MIAIVIPTYDEFSTLPTCLTSLEDSYHLLSSPLPDIHVIVVVNQPIETGLDKTENNQKTLTFLKNQKYPFSLHTLDYTHPGLKCGVGEARKLGMDYAVLKLLRNEDDLIVSLDADATVSPNYLNVLTQRKLLGSGFTLSFEHSFEKAENPEAIRKYDNYLRHMQRELARIGSPFAYISIGSALGTNVKNYKTSGGMPMKNATEDFHFLNKLRKLGEIEHWPEIIVYPLPRKSTRVYLGTGFFLDQFGKDPEGALDQLLLPSPQDFDLLKDFLNLAKQFFLDPKTKTELENKKEWKAFISTLEVVEKLERLKENSRSEESYNRKLIQVVDALFTYRFLRFLTVDFPRKG